MRGADWLASSNPDAMLDRLRDLSPPWDERKLRLFGVACCRRVWDILVDERRRAAVEALERFLDGRETREQMALSARAALDAGESFRPELENGHLRPSMEGARWSAAQAVRFMASGLGGGEQIGNLPLPDRIRHAAFSTASARSFELREIRAWRRMVVLGSDYPPEEETQAELLREIFGNPFRPVFFDPTWRTQDVVDLANAIVEEKDFEGLPVLGDALEEAGCNLDGLLAHCRRVGRHVPGCWALDAVLGRGGTVERREPEAATPARPRGFWRSVRRLVGLDIVGEP